MDINKLNSFLDKASKAISCGPDCQKNQTTDELKNKYIDAESNLLLAKPNYNIAKKNYYTFISGENGYNEIIEKELINESDNIVVNFNNLLNDETNKIHKHLNTYNSILINFKNVEDLNKKYKSENFLLSKKLKQQTNDILTNERKSYYEDQEIDALKSYYSNILLTIYFIIVISFSIFSLIYISQISFKIKIIIFVFFMILPYISSFILGKIIQMFYLLYSVLPKNVYK